MNGQSSPGASSADLVGRRDELGEIEELLAAVAAGGGTLAYLGEPGVGKSVLLDAAATRAEQRGYTVLRVSGVEFERALGFSGLNQLLLPLRQYLDALDPGQRDALAVALGLRVGEPPDRLVVSTATLSLVQAAAAVSPVLIVIDDVQWVDQPSRDALLFLGRRLRGSRIGLLAAVRPGPGVLQQSGLVQRELLPLDHESADQLLRNRFPMLAPRIRSRLLDEAQGNPLALLELPPGLSAGARAGLVRPPATLPLSDRLQGIFAARIRTLPRRTRALLLLVALDPTGDLGRLRRAAGTDDTTDLVRAEDLGILMIRDVDGRMTFRHPLMRSAVVNEISTPDQQRQAHRRLADASTDDPDRQAWHLAEASVEPNEKIAALIEACGERALGRGDSSGVDLLVRSAELSPSPADRSRRLGHAAFVLAHYALGSAERVEQLVAGLRDAEPGSDAALFGATATAWLIMSTGGDTETASRIVWSTLTAAGPSYDVDNPAHRHAFYTVIQLCLSTMDSNLTARFFELLSAVQPQRGPNARLLRLYGVMMLDPAYRGVELLPELDAMIATIDQCTDPVDVARISGACIYADRTAECRSALERGLAVEHDGAETIQAMGARTILAYDAYCRGQWSRALELNAEIQGLGDATQSGLFQSTTALCVGLIAAATGDTAGVAGTTESLDARQRRTGNGAERHYRNIVLAHQGIAGGDFEQAFALATEVSPAGVLPHFGVALWVAFDLIESAVQTGRTDAARQHIAAIRSLEVTRLAPRYAVLADAGEALISGPDAASELFERAVSTPGADRVPFDLARVRLLYGEHLIRSGARGPGRRQLDAAAATFRQLSATPWLLRTEAALARPKTPTAASARLTPLEYQIVSLAASGMTNKQIGGTLYLSPRTVSTYLYRVFPKLGVSTRAGLRDALNALEQRR